MDIISEDNAGRVVLVDAPTNSTVPIPLSIDEISTTMYLTGISLTKGVINSVALSMDNDLFLHTIGSRYRPVTVTGVAFDKAELEDSSAGIGNNTGPGIGIIYDFFNSYEAVTSYGSVATVTLRYNSQGSEETIDTLLMSVPKCKWTSHKGGPFFTQFALRLLPLE